MKCGYCGKSFKSVRAIYQHWRMKGCPQFRPVWEKVVAARKRGHSGRRILAKAFPHLYPTTPMSEEVKEKLRIVSEERKKTGVRPVRKRPRR